MLINFKIQEKKWFVSSDHLMMTELIFPFSLVAQKLRIQCSNRINIKSQGASIFASTIIIAYFPTIF